MNFGGKENFHKNKSPLLAILAALSVASAAEAAPRSDDGCARVRHDAEAALALGNHPNMEAVGECPGLDDIERRDGALSSYGQRDNGRAAADRRRDELLAQMSPEDRRDLEARSARARAGTPRQ